MSASAQYWPVPEDLSCPFFNQNDCDCRVSIPNTPIPLPRQNRYCLTDDHDQCTNYLAKILCQSQTKSSESLLRGFMQK
jgi:hypothetical protein